MTIPDYGGPKKKEKQRQLLLTRGFNQQNSEVGKWASKAKCFILSNIPEPRWYGLVKLRMLQIMPIGIYYSRPNSGLRESWFQDCKRTQEDPDKEQHQETSHHSRRKSSIKDEITHGQTDGSDDLWFLQNSCRQWNHLGYQRFTKKKFS